MSEIDYEAENIRLNEALDRLQEAQDDLALAGIEESGKWEQERAKMAAEIEQLRAILREVNMLFTFPRDLKERIQNEILKE